MARSKAAGRSGSNITTGNRSRKRAAPSKGSSKLPALPQAASTANKKEVKGWLNMHQFWGIALAIALNVIHLGYTGGVVMTRISYLEESARQAKATSVDLQLANVKVATVETKLTSISEQLARIERLVEKSQDRSSNDVRR